MKPGICKHKTSPWHDERCGAGVRYDDVCPRPGDDRGKGYRYPCTKYDALSNHGKRTVNLHGPQGTCDRYEEPSAADIADYKREIEEATLRMMQTLPIIAAVKAGHKDEDWQGVEECPQCGGILHLSHAAYNGHVWGRCETVGCLTWAE